MSLMNVLLAFALFVLSALVLMAGGVKKRFVLLILLLVLGMIACEQNQQQKAQRPNIIFLLSDDQRDNTFGAMGHPFVRTPNVDRLLRQGVRFSNTYIAEPVCSPSRASLFTGMHERVHGVGFSSSYQMTEDQWSRSYPALLRENGYTTGFIGKFGVEYYTFRGRTAEKFDFWYAHDGWTKFFPKEHDSFSTRPYHDAEADIITPIMGEAISAFLDSASTAGRPFCLSVSFNVPHGSQTTSMYTGYEGWHDMIRPADENPRLRGHPVYGSLYRTIDFPIPGDVGTDPHRHIPRHVLDQDRGRKKTYKYDYAPGTVREHHIRYFQTITGMDRVIGGMMRDLERLGLAGRTVIIFASDHGLLMGEYGMGGKALLYDLACKIPCFICDPGIPAAKKGKTVDRLVSSLDIPCTILDYAGVAAPQEMSGRSLVPLVRGEESGWREQLFLESLFTLRDNPFCEGIRRGDWKYIRMFDGAEPYDESDVDFTGRKPAFEQLFNLKKDPGEKINLIDRYQDSRLLGTLRSSVKARSAELNARRARYLETYECVPR